MFDISSQKRFATQVRRLLFVGAIAFCTSASAALPPGFIDELGSSGWNQPTGFTFDGNGRQFAWEKEGRVSVVAADGSKQLLIDISEEVGNWRDYGLLGFALDPGFLTNGRFYLFYVVDRHHLLHFGTSSYDPNADEYFNATIARITCYQADAATGFTTVVPGSRSVLVGETKSSGIPILHTSHGAGALLFGEDGSLMASTGDGASYLVLDDGNAVDSYAAQAIADGIITSKEKVGAFRSQLVDSLSGKILRIDPNTGDGIASNPFFDTSAPRSARSRVWTLGIRNAYRLALKPGSGSTNPADGDPGSLIFGDVGWNQWEEMNLVDSGGANCGWPLFEGLTERPDYAAARTFNLDAPNPLAGTPGCEETHFAFQDLIKQAQKDHTPEFPNPCNPAEGVPATVPHFMHHRPIIEWKHGADVVRVPTYSGNAAAAVSIADPSSSVEGPTFRGNCSTTGFWHTGTGVPEYYANAYFHADHVRQWVRLFRFEETGELKSEEWFTTLPGRITCLGMNPVDGAIHYIDYDRQEIRRIVYIGDTNRTPVASAEADNLFGPSPLTVTFDGSASQDPDGDPISYSWNFGDGSTSSEKSPKKTFTAAGGNPTRYDVTLTVTDPDGATHTTSLIVSADNTPPAAVITSPANGARYNLGTQSIAQLSAFTSDSEQTPSSLQHRWQVTLHHDDHIHPEPPIVSKEAEVMLSPTPVSAEFYAYEIALTVTDDHGLSTTTRSWLYPNDAGVSSPMISPQADGSFAPGTPIELEVDPAGGADRVVYRANGIPVAQATTAPFRATWTPPSAGEYSIVAHIRNGLTHTTSLASAITVSNPAPDDLPPPWRSVQIGDAPLLAESSENEGTFSLVSTGGDTWGSADDVHFTYQTIAGDCQITARVAAMTNTHPWAKAGLMFRTDKSEDSAHAFVAVTPEKGVALFSRSAKGAPTTATVSPGFSAPRWLRLVRSGNTITAFHSDTGSNWSPVKVVVLDLGETIQIGMATAFITGNARGTAAFDQVTTEFGNVGSDWQESDYTATEDPNLPGYFQNGTGSFVQTGSDSFTVTGSGADVYGTSDEFNFVRQSLTGDGEIFAKVESLDATHPWAKAGVMIRSSAAEDAAHGFVAITPEKGAAYVFRKSDGANSTLRRHPIPETPHWVRVVRTGNTVSGFHSTDGRSWVMVSAETIELGSEIEVGLAVTSHQAGTNATADFQDVTILGFGAGNGNVPPNVAVASPTDGATVSPGQDVDLAAWFSDTDGAVVSVGFYANGQLVGQLDSAPWVLETVFPVAGDYEIVAAAIDDGNAVSFSSPATLHVSGGSNPPGSEWNSKDIGPTVATGISTVSESGDLITLQAAGEEIYGTRDSFFFLHQQLNGDGEIVAKVPALSADHAWAKAGLMIRQDLTPASPHAMVALTPSKGALLLSRNATAAETAMKRHPLASAPRWVKLTRSGNNFAAYHSDNGQSWILINQVTVPIFQQALVGLAFTSRSTETQGAATFENVTVSPAIN